MDKDFRGAAAGWVRVILPVICDRSVPLFPLYPPSTRTVPWTVPGAADPPRTIRSPSQPLLPRVPPPGASSEPATSNVAPRATLTTAPGAIVTVLPAGIVTVPRST